MLDLSRGAMLYHQGRAVRAVRPRDLERLVVEDVDTGRLSEVLIADLRPEPTATPSMKPIEALDTARQEEAHHRFELIAPLLPLWPRSRQAVEERAREVGTSAATLYRLLAAYEQGADVNALVRRPRSDAGQSRQSAEVLKLMDEVIEEVYLTRQQPSIQATYQELCARCKVRELKAPSRDTLARQIARLDPIERLKRRRGSRAVQALRPLRGSFPGALAPLDVVQIDHTELDVFIVDELERQEIGRPWITVAIDVMSRVVLGYSISRDRPSFLNAGVCMTHAMLPKDGFLSSRQKRLAEVLGEVEGHPDTLPPLRWPVWGRPTKVMADNAREFRGHMFERSCKPYIPSVELRPVKKPEYGAHIERMMGTIATELKVLPGATFGNVQRRGDYQSQKRAVLTFEELDLWLTIFFAGIYNVRPHRGLKGESPLSVFQKGLLEGTADTPPKGLFPRPSPEEALKMQIDFLPSFEVTIQRTGITLETVTYYHEVLGPYLARRVPGQPSERHVVRRDPRDISQVYFWASDVGRYYAIPFANASWRRLSVWELRALKAQVHTHAGQRVKEGDLIRTQQSLRRLVGRASQTTRETRRQSEKKRAHHSVEPLILPEPSRRAPVLPEDEEPIVPFKVKH